MDTHAEKMGLDPEQLHRLLAQQQQQTEAPAQPEAAGPGSGERPEEPKEEFDFHLKPEELEAYLDQYVIQQREAKAILSTKICTHFNRLNLPPDPEEDLLGNIKNNVLMIGPTGVGKTYLIKLIARKLGVPFVKGDATKFSETGYVGGDVEDLVRELVREANGEIEKAQYGIIYIDEIDKIASSQSSVGPDVSRSGVQRNLLKLMEETEVDHKAPHDIASQMESVIQMQQTGKLEKKKINTRNILFIVSGAFTGLDEIISKRLNKGAVGFRLNTADKGEENKAEDLFRQVRAEDLIAYGFESEFIGRLPVVAVLDQLQCEDLYRILRNPKSSVILAKKRDFRAYGIEVEFDDEALRLLARRAHGEQIGARGLVSAIEKVLLNFEKKLPSTRIERFTVTAGVVENPRPCLQKLLEKQSLQAYIDDFFEAHAIRLKFGAAAEAQAKRLARERGQSPQEFCTELFADYGHGLKLLEKQEFEITPGVLGNPHEALNSLIKDFYSNQS